MQNNTTNIWLWLLTQLNIKHSSAVIIKVHPMECPDQISSLGITETSDTQECPKVCFWLSDSLKSIKPQLFYTVKLVTGSSEVVCWQSIRKFSRTWQGKLNRQRNMEKRGERPLEKGSRERTRTERQTLIEKWRWRETNIISKEEENNTQRGRAGVRLLRLQCALSGPVCYCTVHELTLKLHLGDCIHVHTLHSNFKNDSLSPLPLSPYPHP
jgi:hypothetical protein